MKFYNILSFRGKLYTSLILLLTIFYVIYNISKGPGYSNSMDGGVVFLLYSEISNSPFEPPFCEVGIISQSGFENLTHNEVYKNSLSYVANSETLYFESKKNRLLGLSAASELYQIDLNKFETQESTINLEDGATNIRVISEDLVVYEKTITNHHYLVVRDLSIDEDVVRLQFPSGTLLDIFFANDVMLVYNYDKPWTDEEKIRAFNLDSRNEKFLDQSIFHGKSIVNASGNYGFVLSEIHNDTLFIYDLNDSMTSLKEIFKFDISNFEDVELKYVSDDNIMFVEDSDEANIVYQCREKFCKEIFSTNYVDEVMYVEKHQN